MRVASKMDAGPILLARATPIAPGETQGTLKEKLAELGASALLEALEKLRLGRLIETPQDESLATYTSPVSKADAVIDWNADATRIERMVRAYDPWPVVRTRFGGEELLVWRAAVDDSSPPAVAASPGATPDGRRPPARRGRSRHVVRTKPDVAVQCGRGRIVLAEVQAAGRNGWARRSFSAGGESSQASAWDDCAVRPTPARGQRRDTPAARARGHGGVDRRARARPAMRPRRLARRGRSSAARRA